MKILVTGGCGFIGSHLVDALMQRGDRVRILDDLSSGTRDWLPTGAELHVGCVTDAETVSHAMEDVDACYHLAAIASVPECRRNWYASHRINQSGLVNVLDQATRTAGRRGLQSGLPVVYASSAAVYGDDERIPLKEQQPATPISGYGCDKSGCELQARAAGMMYGQPSLGLRFFNVYGSRQNPCSPYSGVISRFFDLAARRDPLVIYGDGKQARDFIHVNDIVRALLLALNHSRSSAPVYNVCTGHAISILDLARKIMVITGSGAPLAFAPPRAEDIRCSVGDAACASKELGFTAKMAIDEGLSSLYRELEAAKQRC